MPRFFSVRIPVVNGTEYLISLRTIGSDTFPQMLLPITRQFLSEKNYYCCVLIRQLFCNFIFIDIYVCLHKLRILIRGGFLLCNSYGYLLNSKKSQTKRRTTTEPYKWIPPCMYGVDAFRSPLAMAVRETQPTAELWLTG